MVGFAEGVAVGAAGMFILVGVMALCKAHKEITSGDRIDELRAHIDTVEKRRPAVAESYTFYVDANIRQAKAYIQELLGRVSALEAQSTKLKKARRK